MFCLSSMELKFILVKINFCFRVQKEEVLTGVSGADSLSREDGAEGLSPGDGTEFLSVDFYLYVSQ